VANYSIRITASAAKELESLQKLDRQKIVERIRSLASNPRPPGAEKLSGQDKYRIRQGNFRILYLIHDNELIVVVVKIGDRKEVYR
jgi:mRNA interferase RelE/StbE